MKKITIEMPVVSQCNANQCGYNLDNTCHAKAITIGDANNPNCDTFLEANHHNKENRRIAGVGACKVGICKFNTDFECTVGNIIVGFTGQKITCLTFSKGL